jgi:hypothetical protein
VIVELVSRFETDDVIVRVDDGNSDIGHEISITKRTPDHVNDRVG